MIPWIRLTLPLTAILLEACVDSPQEVATTADVVSSSSTSAGPGTSTTPGSTTADEGTVGTQGATGMETTMGAVDTTAGSTDETTMGIEPTSSSGESSSGEPPPPPECVSDEECPSNEICTMGTCVAACGGVWGAGTYAYCLDQYGSFAAPTLCGGGHTCIYDSYPVNVATCSRQTCTTACDCPAPPATGNATVTCNNITQDAIADCYLSCANGETCPNGMACQLDLMGNPLYCANPVQPLAMYGNCGDVNAPCANGGTCAMSGGGSVCVSLCEGAGVGACDPAPAGSTYAAACDTVISPPMGADCYLPCGTSDDCPPGMQCINDTGDLLCMW